MFAWRGHTMTTTAEPLEDYADRERVRVMTTSHAVDLWLGELARKNHSERTIGTYRGLLDKLCDAFQIADVDELTATQVRRFLDEQARKRDGTRKSAATIAQNVTIINGFLDWLTAEGVLARNPVRRNGQRILSRPRQVAPDENDNVTTVSSTDVVRLLDVADRGWGHDQRRTLSRRLAVNVAAYLGPRRKALSTVRVGDYDREERTLRFVEKGGKTIAKPVPDRLATVIEAAISSGLYDDADDYLVPSRAQQRNKGERDDRVIWHLIREVAEEAEVTTHVHALRAAFAVHYLETHPHQNSIFALKDLMGHKRVETTLVYLRRLKRRQQMETVRDLDWGAAPHDNERIAQIARKPLVAKGFTEKEGFEPSISSLLDDLSPGSQGVAVEPGAQR